jgi:hypothetical protein
VVGRVVFSDVVGGDLRSPRTLRKITMDPRRLDRVNIGSG